MGRFNGREYKCGDDTETVVFNGREYHRNANAKQIHRRRYFWGKREPGNGKKTALHVAVWEHHNGPVPEGMLIHHKDDNPVNNDISNLQCVTYSEHGKIHGTGKHLQEYRNSKMYQHVCEHCGSDYETFRKSRTRFCSPKCQNRALCEKRKRDRRLKKKSAST